MSSPFSPYLNVAALNRSTCSLGPGERAVVWVQGCPFHCQGCLAPEWIPFRPAQRITPEELVDELIASSSVTGLTFSGGEPMQQASGLAVFAKLARERRNLNIICFTGYRFERLVKEPPTVGVSELLDQVDVLVDGPYMASMNDGIGLRGSSNQRIIRLTTRLNSFDFEGYPRQVEIHVKHGELEIVGIPTLKVQETLDGVFQSLFTKNQMAEL